MAWRRRYHDTEDGAADDGQRSAQQGGRDGDEQGGGQAGKYGQ